MSLPIDQISNYLDHLEKEARAFKKEALKISWFMRGGALYDDVMLFSLDERNLAHELIKDNLETTKKTNFPFF